MIAVLAVVDKTKPLADGFGNSGWRKIAISLTDPGRPVPAILNERNGLVTTAKSETRDDGRLLALNGEETI